MLPIVTFNPAELACIAGLLLRLRAGLALLGEARLKDVMEGDGRGCAEAGLTREGDWRIAGEFTREEGRQCFTESEPDWELLLLLGEPGEETITWKGNNNEKTNPI